EAGRIRPEMVLSSVVLPAPLGPTSATISPSPTSRLTPSRAVAWPSRPTSSRTPRITRTAPPGPGTPRSPRGRGGSPRAAAQRFRRPPRRRRQAYAHERGAGGRPHRRLLAPGAADPERGFGEAGPGARVGGHRHVLEDGHAAEEASGLESHRDAQPRPAVGGQ